MYEVLLHPDAEEVYIKADKALAKKNCSMFRATRADSTLPSKY